MIRILFICHGNICRSPMAEFVMKKLVKDMEAEERFQIDSAATSYEEIGKVLSLEIGTVKSRIFRARRKLCEFLAGDGNISLPSSSTKTGGGDKP